MTLYMQDIRPVPTYYVMILESLDGSGYDDLMINITVQRREEVIILSVKEQLLLRTLSNVSVQAYGCEENTVMNGIELSKLLRYYR